MESNEEPKEVMPESQDEAALQSAESFEGTKVDVQGGESSFNGNFAPTFGAEITPVVAPAAIGSATAFAVPPVPTAQTEPPAASLTPAPGLSVAPKKKSKKGLIIGVVLAAVVALGLASAAAAYTVVYNNPQNAVNDAFAKALAAKNGVVDGTASLKADNNTASVTYTYTVNDAAQSSVDASMNFVGTGDIDVDLKGQFVTTKESYYIKVDGVQSAITGLLGEEYGTVIDEYYGGLLDKVDNKWVVVTLDDINELTNGELKNDEATCIQEKTMRVQTDAQAREEVMKVYGANPLFTIEAKGSDSDGNRYGLTPVSSQDAKKFFVAFIETQYFTAIDDCTTDNLKESFTDELDASESSLDDTTKATLDVWVDGWTHNLNKIVLTAKSEDEYEMNAEFKFKLNTNPSVTIPEAETTVDDIKAEIESALGDFMPQEEATTIDDSMFDVEMDL